MERITIKEYAANLGKNYYTTLQKVKRGGFKTAQKIGNQWFIDADEPYIDNRKAIKPLETTIYASISLYGIVYATRKISDYDIAIKVEIPAELEPIQVDDDVWVTHDNEHYLLSNVLSYFDDLPCLMLGGGITMLRGAEKCE